MCGSPVREITNRVVPAAKISAPCQSKGTRESARHSPFTKTAINATNKTAIGAGIKNTERQPHISVTIPPSAGAMVKPI